MQLEWIHSIHSVVITTRMFRSCALHCYVQVRTNQSARRVSPMSAQGNALGRMSITDKSPNGAALETRN
jgi:hypothetical protein